jgi:hypothetical protein
MSWSTSYQYACIEFQQEFSVKEIRLMLAELPPIILEKHQASPHHFWGIEEIALDLEGGSISKDHALNTIEESLWLYVDQVETAHGKTTLIVRSDDDESDYGDSEIAHEVAKHLFSKTGNTHFIMRSAAFDKCGGYSHQWIGYLKKGEVVLKHTDEYFQQMFEIQPALMAV